MKFHNQLRYATQIVTTYRGEMPLHTWLKNFFREHKQMGSRDRKLVSGLVYSFYRLGHAIRDCPVEDRILTGFFLCSDAAHELLEYFRPEWNALTGLSLEEKIAVCRQSNPAFDPADIFPWKGELSEGIDHHAFCLSFLRQPDLFLRVRPGQLDAVRKKLGQSYTFIPPFTIRLPNGFKVEELFTPDKEVVIQDYSSQRIASFLQRCPDPILDEMPDETPDQTLVPMPDPVSGPRRTSKAPVAVWDVCAASGGKSILAYDLCPGIRLTVSDIRESILHNLRQRFRQAGITHYTSFAADLTDAKGKTAARKTGVFDLIIVDAPCSGSGTWSRTPEELYFFHPDKIRSFSDLQKRILSNIPVHLAANAALLYITCSVFRKENEEMAAFIAALGLKPDIAESIIGYDVKADSMFAARFTGE
jgi:16S rRNA (cytosine967-C5)-methyltransferase